MEPIKYEQLLNIWVIVYEITVVTFQTLRERSSQLFNLFLSLPSTPISAPLHLSTFSPTLRVGKSSKSTAPLIGKYKCNILIYLKKIAIVGSIYMLLSCYMLNALFHKPFIFKTLKSFVFLATPFVGKLVVYQGPLTFSGHQSTSWEYAPVYDRNFPFFQTSVPPLTHVHFETN